MRNPSRRLRAALLAAVLLISGAPAAARATAAPAAHSVTYDGYSWLVDGQRVYLWSGEFHYFRLPSPDLWRDVLTKMKAGGFNAVSLYFDWAYHSPRPGTPAVPHRTTSRPRTTGCRTSARSSPGTR